MEDLKCPECGEILTEEQLKESLVCPHCKTNLRDKKYIDFLELLVYNDIIDDVDFFDINLYKDEMLSTETEDYDESEIDPASFEKKKEIWSEFEDELEFEDQYNTEDEEAWDIEYDLDEEEEEEEGKDIDEDLDDIDNLEEDEDL